MTGTARSFSYRALDADGATRSGHVAAADESGALRELIHRGLTPLQIDAVGHSDRLSRSAAGRARVTLVDRITLVQELATLLGAGISLSEALPSLVTAYADQGLGAGLARVDRDVRGGQRLSAAMAQADTSKAVILDSFFASARVRAAS